MKSKFTTYLLIIVVLVVWGIIVKKLFFSRTYPPAAAQSDALPAVTAPQEEALTFDYRNPFRPKPLTKAAETAPDTAVMPVPSAVEKFDVKYIGRLKSGKKTNYIVNSGGGIQTLSLDEELNGFRLIRVSADSLYFKKNGHTYTIPVE